MRDLLRCENDITARQSELQSLTDQQRHLSEQTAMATITVHLSTRRTTSRRPVRSTTPASWRGCAAGGRELVLRVLAGVASPLPMACMPWET
jgi:hypothetical protein